MKNYLRFKSELEQNLSDNQIDCRDYLRVKRKVHFDKEYLDKYGIVFLPIEEIRYDYEIVKLEDKSNFELMRVSDILQELSTILNKIE